MPRITLRDAAKWCGGTVEEKYAEVSFLGAGNDTRNLQPGQLHTISLIEADAVNPNRPLLLILRHLRTLHLQKDSGTVPEKFLEFLQKDPSDALISPFR